MESSGQGRSVVGAGLWQAYLLVAVVVGQYYFVSAYGSSPAESLYTAISVSAVVAVLVGLVVQRPRVSSGWYLVGIAVWLFVAGDLVYADLEADNLLVPVPSTADWLYLASYPALIGGIVLVGLRAGGPLGGVRLVAGVAVTAVGVVAGWQLYFGDYLTDPFLDRGQRIVAVAYPVLDAVALGAAAWLVAPRGRPSTPAALVAGGVAGLAVANAVFNVRTADLSYSPAGFAEAGWLVFTTLLAVAVLHPATRAGKVAVRASADDRSASASAVAHGAESREAAAPIVAA
jgi:hypothetical protein